MGPECHNVRVLVEEEYVLDEHQAALDWSDQGCILRRDLRVTHSLGSNGEESIQDTRCQVRVEACGGRAPSGRAQGHGCKED